MACRRCSNNIPIPDLRPGLLDWTKTTMRADEKHLSFGIWCDLSKRLGGSYCFYIHAFHNIYAVTDWNCSSIMLKPKLDAYSQSPPSFTIHSPYMYILLYNLASFRVVHGHANPTQGYNDHTKPGHVINTLGMMIIIPQYSIIRPSYQYISGFIKKTMLSGMLPLVRQDEISSDVRGPHIYLHSTSGK